MISQCLRTRVVSIKSVDEGKTCRLFLYVTRNIFLRHPAQNIRLLVASIIVYLLPYCARLHGQKKVTAPFDYDKDDDIDDDTWKDDIEAFFDDSHHMEVRLNCLMMSVS